MTQEAHPALTLHYMAENVVDQGLIWPASQFLGDITLAHIAPVMQDRHVAYRLADADDILHDVSEQPHLPGNVIMHVGRGQGAWVPHGTTIIGLDAVPESKYDRGDFLAVEVLHDPSYARLLRVVLPLGSVATKLFQREYLVQTLLPSSGFPGVLDLYRKGDTTFLPRQLQAYAGLFRQVKQREVEPTPFIMWEPGGKEAFLDKHFPWQDAALTGGNGKTVRMRAAQPLKRK